jgi:hypothetical protein
MGLTIPSVAQGEKSLHFQHGKFFLSDAAFGIALALIGSSQNGFWDKSP